MLIDIDNDDVSYNPFYLGKFKYEVSQSSMWVYIIAPLIGSLLASVFHWKTVTLRRKMKFDNEIEEKRLNQK